MRFMRARLLILGILLANLLYASASGSIVYSGGDLNLRSGFSLYEDSVGRMGPLEALSANYVQLPDGVPNLQVSRSAHWLKFNVFNSCTSSALVVSIDHAEIDELDVYFVKDNVPHLIGHTGQSRDLSERIQPYHGFKFNLNLPSGSEGTLLLRVRGFKHIHVPVSISGVESIVKQSSSSTFLIGGYIAIMLAMALYNLFLFFSIKDTSYLWYVLYILFISLAQMALIGIGQQEVWGDNIWLASRSSILFALIAIALGMEFARRFINTRDAVPRLHKGVPVFHLLVALDLSIYLFKDPWTGYMLAQMISGWSALYLMVMVITAIRKGSRQARFFLLAWTPFLVGVLMFVLKDAGAIPHSGLTRYAMPIGSAIEGVLLSFGLADRINILRREKERSQAEALAASLENERIIREQNVILEQRVQERTHALQESNDHLKRTQTQLVNAEKMASLGQLTAGIAHEINNPVNFITSNIPPLRRNLGEILEVLEDYRKATVSGDAKAMKEVAEKERKLGLDISIEELGDILGSIEEGAGRTAEIVRGLRNFSRLDEDDLKPADLNDCIRSTITVLGPQFRDQVTLDLQLGALPKVECYAGKLNQVFMNMLNNAAQAVKSKHPAGLGRVTVRTAQLDDHVVIAIQDNGVGMTDAVKARIYEPFFTTKDVGEGTGLGLSIAYSIVEKHHGRIEVDSTDGEGTEFRVVLPLEQPRQAHLDQPNAQRA